MFFLVKIDKHVIVPPESLGPKVNNFIYNKYVLSD